MKPFDRSSPAVRELAEKVFLAWCAAGASPEVGRKYNNLLLPDGSEVTADDAIGVAVSFLNETHRQ